QTGNPDPEILTEQHERKERTGDDDRIDRPTPLLRPVDILEVEPEGELIQGQRGADPEEDGERRTPRRGVERESQVAGRQEQQDTPDQVMDMQLPDHQVVEGPAA